VAEDKHKIWYRLILGCLGLILSGCGGVEFNNPLAQATATAEPTATVAPPAAAKIDCQPTPGQFANGFLEEFPTRTELAPPEMPGERMKISGTIYASDCITPLAGATLQVWHTDSQGNYDRTEPYDLVGQMHTDEAGHYEFSSIKPVGYEERPAHVHMLVTANDGRVLSTQMFFADDPALAGATVPAALLTELSQKNEAGGPMLYGTFDIVLPVEPPVSAPEIITDEDL
jgi:catechol 1,2-dioxygenase